MSRLKRAFVICMAVMLGTICAAGCASDEKKEDSKLPGYVVYTANSSGTGLDSERYEIIETEVDDVINRLYNLPTVEFQVYMRSCQGDRILLSAAESFMLIYPKAIIT